VNITEFGFRVIQLEVTNRCNMACSFCPLPIREGELRDIATEDTFRILEEESAGEVGGVFHCFTGDRAMARQAIDAGFCISLSGIVTFPRATELHEVAKIVPLDRLLVETDSPYLAPVPHRGTRNEPAHVVCVAEAVARLRGTTTEAVGQATHENFERLFGR